MTMNNNVYIATLPRSGSTLLGMILNNNARVFHMGESSYWGKLKPSEIFCSCGETCCEVLEAVYKRASNLPEVKAIYDACNQIDRQEEPGKIYHSFSLPSQDDNVMISETAIAANLEAGCIGLEQLADIFRQLTGRDVIVDNTKNIRFAECLVERQWRIIVMTRDPRGIVNSSKNAGLRKGVPRPVAMKIPVLINFATRALGLIASPSILLVRYEDLCQSPKSEMEKVCHFLDISYADGMLKFRNDNGHTLMGNRMRFGGEENVVEDKSWTTQLSEEEIDLLQSNNELTELYHQLGYQLKGG